MPFTLFKAHCAACNVVVLSNQHPIKILNLRSYSMTKKTACHPHIWEDGTKGCLAEKLLKQWIHQICCSYIFCWSMNQLK